MKTWTTVSIPVTVFALAAVAFLGPVQPAGAQQIPGQVYKGQWVRWNVLPYPPPPPGWTSLTMEPATGLAADTGEIRSVLHVNPLIMWGEELGWCSVKVTVEYPGRKVEEIWRIQVVPDPPQRPLLVPKGRVAQLPRYPSIVSYQVYGGTGIVTVNTAARTVLGVRPGFCILELRIRLTNGTEMTRRFSVSVIGPPPPRR